MYHVSNSKIERITNGSAKIEEITQQVIRLKNDDPTVKIVIFSQWSIVLAELGNAFSMNEISYRKDLSRFSDTIREFKVSNQLYFIIYTAPFIFIIVVQSQYAISSKKIGPEEKCVLF